MAKISSSILWFINSVVQVASIKVGSKYDTHKNSQNYFWTVNNNKIIVTFKQSEDSLRPKVTCFLLKITKFIFLSKIWWVRKITHTVTSYRDIVSMYNFVWVFLFNHGFSSKRLSSPKTRLLISQKTGNIFT